MGVVVPPNGRARIWVQYKNYTGKTVFHGHFLAHEDTGMMSTLFIGKQDYVFDWKEHQQLFLGAGIGMLLAGILVLIHSRVVVESNKNNNKKKNHNKEYSPVALNELKS